MIDDHLPRIRNPKLPIMQANFVEIPATQDSINYTVVALHPGLNVERSFRQTINECTFSRFSAIFGRRQLPV